MVRDCLAMRQERRRRSKGLKISLSNYRCFARTPEIEVRPLTLVVGENSSGKSSLMAALRFGLELSASQATSFFNVYPFDLGPYEDIVHESQFQSTAERFSISIEKFVNLQGPRSFPLVEQEENGEVLVTCRFFFKSHYGDTVLSSIRLEVDGDQMDLRFAEDMTVTILYRDERFEINQPKLFSGSSAPAVSLQKSFYLLLGLRYRSEESNLNRVGIDRVEKFAGFYDAFLSDNHTVVATPPVRSVPKKVYTSASDSSLSSSEGAPHELSKIKRSDKKRWSKINKELNRFGKQSGLFNRLDVKKLTSQDSGPFQLKVTVRGRSTPIADVGYGVSQSLPIFADLIAHKNSKSALLLQQPEVHLHPRAQAELATIFAEFVSHNSQGIIVAETHSDHLIDRVRIEIREGRLNPSLVNLVFLDPQTSDVDVHQISFDREGNLVGAPQSYREFFIREQERVLGY